MTFSVERKRITPAQVDKWYEDGLDNRNNRPMRKRWVNYLSRQMLGGKFLPTTQIAIAHLDGRSVLVNGQHTLAAIRQSGQAIDLPLMHHKIADVAELNDLYARYDIGNKRTFSDAIKFYGIAEITDLSNSYINKLASALGLISSGYGKLDVKREVDNAEWIPSIVHYAPYVKELLGSTKKTTLYGHKLYMMPTLAVIVVTLAHGPDDAMDFWVRMAHNDGLKKGDPAKRLFEYLQYEHSSDSQGPGDTAPQAARIIAYCWSANYEGRDIHKLPVTAIKRGDIKIAGTPYAMDAEPWQVSDNGELIPWLSID